MMAPVCCRPWRTSRLLTRALAAVAGAADRRCTPSPHTYGSQRLLVAGLGLPQWAWMPDPCDQPLMLVALYA